MAVVGIALSVLALLVLFAVVGHYALGRFLHDTVESIDWDDMDD